MLSILHIPADSWSQQTINSHQPASCYRPLNPQLYQHQNTNALGMIKLNDALQGVGLTHWGRDKMDAISQMTPSNAFSCMKMLEFQLKFHWSLFLRVQLTIVHHWFRWWLGADQTASHYLNQWWLDYWRIYASLGLNELTYCGVQILYSLHWVSK